MKNGYTPVQKRLKKLQQIEKSWVKAFKRDPAMASFLGFHDDDHSLPPNDEEAILDGIKDHREILEKFNRVDTRRFPLGRRIDVELAKNELNLDLTSYETPIRGKPFYLVWPSAAEEIGDALDILLYNDALSANHIFDAVTGRIEQVPRYLREETSRLKAVVPRWRNIQVKCARGLFPFFDEIIEHAEREGYRHIRRLRNRIEKAKESLHTYVRCLRGKPTVGPIFRGMDFAEAVLRYQGIPMSVNDVYQLAVDFTEEHLPEIEKAKRKVCEKRRWGKRTDFREVVSRLRHMYRLSPEYGIGAFMQSSQKAEQLRLETGYFPEPPDYDVRVIRTPAYSEDILPIAATQARGPFETNGAKHKVYLTIPRDDQCDITTLDLDSLALHECTPGHAYHSCFLNGNGSITRKLIDAPDIVEGFASMVEQLSEDYLLNSDERDLPERRLLELAELMRLGPRVCIDLYFMSGDEKFMTMGNGFDPRKFRGPFRKAEAMLSHYTGFSKRRTRGEINWYSQYSGHPLCYLEGQKRLGDLKDDMKEYLGRGYSERKFIQGVLSAGKIPVSYLRMVFEHKGWVEKS